MYGAEHVLQYVGMVAQLNPIAHVRMCGHIRPYAD